MVGITQKNWLNMNQQHEFAVYLPNLAEQAFANATEIILSAKQYPELIHRITRVLRLSMGEPLILFDRKIHIFATVDYAEKKQVRLIIHQVNKNEIIKPYVRALLPLLKRAHLEKAIYELTELGVNEIQLVLAHKVQAKWGGAKEFERLNNIAIAAAEQSKCFSFAQINEPCLLNCALEKVPGAKLFADPGGQPMLEVIAGIKDDSPEQITLLVGPEGGMVDEEIELIKQAGFHFVALTPTILRACQAASLGCGVLRLVYE